MAAGDVTVNFNSGRSIRGKRMIGGTVQLDGSNPTDIDLSAYLSVVRGAVASIRLATPGIAVDGLNIVTVSYSGQTVNLYASGNNGTDPTPTASTDNTNFCDFFAWGDA